MKTLPGGEEKGAAQSTETTPKTPKFSGSESGQEDDEDNMLEEEFKLNITAKHGQASRGKAMVGKGGWTRKNPQISEGSEDESDSSSSSSGEESESSSDEDIQDQSYRAESAPRKQGRPKGSTNAVAAEKRKQMTSRKTSQPVTSDL